MENKCKKKNVDGVENKKIMIELKEKNLLLGKKNKEKKIKELKNKKELIAILKKRKESSDENKNNRKLKKIGQKK